MYIKCTKYILTLKCSNVVVALDIKPNGVCTKLMPGQWLGPKNGLQICPDYVCSSCGY